MKAGGYTTTDAGAKLLALAKRTQGKLLVLLTETAWRLHGASELDCSPDSIVGDVPEGWSNDYWLAQAADLSAGPTELETARMRMVDEEFAAFEASWLEAKAAKDAKVAADALAMANEKSSEDLAAESWRAV